ncbi:MAG: dienelactone hydrolase family protein [Alphaproteobacteria bacterium]|jgi:dienelactone hydrolase|nr:dienelactone hydrolase family protein [Alphaproteobacteria bacterium]MDP6872918.1 dienelactone hydrolase family protein [Alphaproteobacteria bacterium]
MRTLRLVTLLAILAPLLAGPAWAQESVKFRAAGTPPTALQMRMAKQLGEEAKATPGLQLHGQLHLPTRGKAPYPALVLLHDCRGITGTIEDWALRLADWGYMSLVVDSYGPRRHKPGCGSYDDVESVDQTFDALGALQFLGRRDDVIGDRIGLIGWSIGGSKVLAAMNKIGVHNLYAEKFHFGVAFYPQCLTASGPFIGPILMLIGGADDWTKAQRCQTLSDANSNSAHPPHLRIYPAAYHFFDDPGAGPVRYRPEIENREKSPTRGATWGHDPAAQRTALGHVRDFLARQRP